jgi:phosphoserine/homoserine phosphotransferase
MADHKRSAVRAFRSLNYRVVAAGDSYNDTTMLAEADAGFLFRAPANVRAEFPQFPALDSFDDLLTHLTAAL